MTHFFRALLHTWVFILFWLQNIHVLSMAMFLKSHFSTQSAKSAASCALEMLSFRGFVRNRKKNAADAKDRYGDNVTSILLII